MFGLNFLGPLGMATMGDGRPDNSQADMDALTKAYAAAHIKRPAAVGPKNYAQAQHDLQLTPQERSLYERHLSNLNGPGGVDNPDGSRSTLYQAVQEHGGKFYNIPTVWNGKRETEKYTKPDGTVMDVPNSTAIANVEKAGWHNFPSAATPEEADARYEKMHSYMDKDTAEHMDTKGKYANARVARGWEAFGPQPTYPQGGDPVASGNTPTPPAPYPQGEDPMGAPALYAARAPAPAAAPMPAPRPPEAPQAPPEMGFFQRNAAMMQDPNNPGSFIDPEAASRANASGPDVIQKLLNMFHDKA